MNQDLERFEPSGLGGRIGYEHLHRYAICSDRVVGRKVLDVACGAGYGTHILAEVAAEVTGVDVDPAAVRSAKQKYKRKNLNFLAADCLDLPFEAASFDVVVANEMIEHIEEQDRFLAEVKRVLKPGGLLMVSTPNKPIYNRYKAPNPFHVAELDIPEFRGLLSQHFEHVRFTGLRMALVSAAFEMDGSPQASSAAAAKTYRGVVRTGDKPGIGNDQLSLEEPEYVLAACSDQVIEDLGQSTIFFSNDDDLWLEHEKVMAWASQLHEEDEVLRADLRQVREELEAERRDRADTDSRPDRQHFELSARLLGKMTGSSVGPESISTIEALFTLNERLLTQSARLDTLRDAQSRADELEARLRSSFAAREKLMNELRAAQDLVEGERQQRARIQEERDSRLRDLVSARGEYSALSEKFEGFRAESAAQLAQIRLELDRAKAELKTLHTPVDEAGPDGASAGAQGASARERQLRRLEAAQRKIREQLSSAHGVVQHALPAASPVRQVSGVKRLLRQHPLQNTVVFDGTWVANQLGDGAPVSIRRYLRDSSLHRLDPHPLFAAAEYLARYPDVAESGTSPLQHYLEFGWREGRDPHPYFANDWYLQQNPDVLNAGTNPLEHYLRYGWHEGRRPNPVFDPTAYLTRHEDVRAEGVEPLTHYVVHGRSEDREVPFEGLEKSWEALRPQDTSGPLLDNLLKGRASSSRSEQPRSVVSGEWPLEPLNDYWIPQALRDYLIGRQSEALIPLYTYFYSVMDAYAEVPDEFVRSAACQEILQRARLLSAQREESSVGELDASVIVPVYNNILDTMLCVVSLLESNPKASFEVIVADDCSSDDTPRLIGEIGGVVRHFRQRENQGFVGNCNTAAEQAAGRTMVLLNNDTLILPGWLDGLIGPFDQFEKVGLVGSKLINWDGRLQEAGGIFWKDGSAWNFGRGGNPLDPEFNYLKDVDYCSGAAIAIPTDLWRRLGGFDAVYKPAYCEDSDLAFRIREAGFRTLYNPSSELIHHEGRSHGCDTGVGIKAYQLVNQQRLTERWSAVLDRDHLPNGQNVLRARDRSIRKAHILVVDHYVPQVDKDAGSRTMFSFLEALTASSWAVTFWPENLYQDPIYTPAVQQLGVEVIYGVKYADKFTDFLRSRAGLYDAVLLSRPHVATHFIDDVRSLTDARVLYYGHDVHFERMKAQREVAGSTIEEDAVTAMKTLEVDLCNRCDVIMYPSEDEARLMAEHVSPRVQSLAIPAYRFGERSLSAGEQAADRIDGPAQPARLLFVGGFAHGPNVDGIAWFCREVAPILRKEGFDFQLDIAGSNPTGDIWDLESETTHVLGFVSDGRLGELYRDASIVIAPLRFGAGVKGKVVEAMAHGVPVTTTAVGAQGLSQAKDYLFLGDTPEEFAAAVRSAAEPEAAREKARSAVRYVRDHYSQSAMVDVFQKVLSTASISKAA